ncbi:MAG: bifunctional phosphopantothenoylcysteine decarboxylase/phosphopantothenate--cysteine ligase CoaBC [Chthoniobacterales bacterium]
MTSPKTIILGVSGSIAAYKAADLTSQLVKRGYSVHVIMTRHATEFVGPMTFQTLSRNPVMLDLQDEKENWKPGHIDLADRADLLLIAPATANIIAKLANGIADDALSSTALGTLAKILIAPAMNGKMWLHPATQENVKKLSARGAQFIGPENGMLACGYTGVGRLWNTDEIVLHAENLLCGKSNARVVKKIRVKRNQAKKKKIVDEKS